MRLKRLELNGFKSFAKNTKLDFDAPVSAIVGPNGSGKSNVAEAVRWVLGEQSMKSLRGKKGEDLIWNGSSTLPRSSKASVSLVFDNGEKIFPVEFEEVIVTRTVYRDGVNEYSLNNSVVRLKDVLDLMSHVGLGASGHHIISQGESDRILNANPKERRQMIEDALGLTLYEMKKEEAFRKLKKTRENMDKVEAVKREIQPHLNFLKRQIGKAEEAISVKENLKFLYGEYLAKEEEEIKSLRKQIDEKKIKPEYEIARLERELRDTAGQSLSIHASKEIDKMKEVLKEKENMRLDLRAREISIEREAGRFEGMVELETKRGQNAGTPDVLPVSSVRGFLEKIEKSLESMLFTSDFSEIRKLAEGLKTALKEIKEKIGMVSKEAGMPNLLELNDSLEKLKKESDEVKKGLVLLSEEINFFLTAIAKKEADILSMEKNKTNLEIRLSDLRNSLKLFEYEEEKYLFKLSEFTRDAEIAKAILGEKPACPESVLLRKFSAGERETLRGKIERIKIKLEDLGGIGEETVREYEDVKKRDEFLEKELHDLRETDEELEKMMAELGEKVDLEFGEGVNKINAGLGEFFGGMFNGGRAELKISSLKKKKKDSENLHEDNDLEEENKEEEGVEIAVSFSRKKISSLQMLSGGERALTSIAVLFAMTQVNPPPFLILDETDAALDEANSKRYGETLKNLSQKTQLIVITHNRETMKQAGILYGVTMGADSVSKLLSIKFEEAETYAGRG